MHESLKHYGDQPISRGLERHANLAGTGLPFGLWKRKGGVDDDVLFRQLGQVTVAPSVRLGIRFNTDPSVYDPRPLDECVKFLTARYRDEGVSMLRGRNWRHFLHGIEHCIPLILPPYDVAAYADLTNAIEFDLRLRADPGLIPTLPRTPRADLIRPDPIQFECVRPGGPVTRQHVRDFLTAFPDCAEPLADRLDGRFGANWGAIDPDAINRFAGSLLGIEVDLRAGSMISSQELAFARSLTHVFDDTGLGIERVDAYTALLREPDLHGACWSVMVDQILNGRFPGIDRLFRNQVPQNAGRWYSAPSDRVH